MANNQNFKVKNGLEVGLGADIGSDLAVGSNIYTKGSLIFEGATDDEFEVTLTVTDPTADRTITLPDADGTFVVSTGDTTTAVQSELNLSLAVDATGVLTITGDAQGLATTDSPTFAGLTLNSGSITFEGATANNFETTLTITDPTADRTIAFPNASGIVAVSVTDTTTSTQGDLNLDFTLNAAGNVSATGDAHGLATGDSPQFTGLTLTGDLSVEGNTTLGNAATDTITFNGTIAGGTPLVFEGATANGFQASFVITDPTTDRTITFPDASGTVAFTSGSDVLTISNGSATTTLQTADTLTIAGGTYLTSTVSGNTVTINHNNTTRTDTTSAESPAVGGTVDVVSSVTTNTEGHVTAIDVKTVTLPSDADTLDGIDSTSFLRSDASDEATGIINFSNGSTFFSNTSATGDVNLYLAQGTGAGLTATSSITWDDSQTSLRLFNTESTTSLNIGSSLTWSSTATGTKDILFNDYNDNILPDATANNRNIGSASAIWNTVYATTFEGTATNAQYADLAEKYLADDIYGPGTVIAIGGDAEVTAAHDEIAHSVLGVVSTAPAFLMNKDLANGTAIALKGRVPVKCVGTVRKGDRLAPSHFAGYATVDNSRTAWSFAIALEDGADGLVEAVIL